MLDPLLFQNTLLLRGMIVEYMRKETSDQTATEGQATSMGSMGDGGLSEIVNLLDQLGIAYWIDSGVLLGLARSGAINSWEKDIDLGATSDQIERILKNRPIFEKEGYRFQVNKYGGLIYSINLVGLISDAKKLPVAIHFFYEVGNFLWSPQTQLYVPPPMPDICIGKISFVGRFLRKTITRIMSQSTPVNTNSEFSRLKKPSSSNLKKILGYLYKKTDKALLAKIWPISELFTSYTWVIPKSLILPLTGEKFGTQLYQVPSRTNDYLQYRYGNWREPVKIWCYWQDDGAIIRDDPFLVREKLLHEKF